MQARNRIQAGRLMCIFHAQLRVPGLLREAASQEAKQPLSVDQPCVEEER